MNIYREMIKKEERDQKRSDLESKWKKKKDSRTRGMKPIHLVYTLLIAGGVISVPLLLAELFKRLLLL